MLAGRALGARCCGGLGPPVLTCRGQRGLLRALQLGCSTVGVGGLQRPHNPVCTGPPPFEFQMGAQCPSQWLCRGDSMVGWESLSASTHPLDPELYVAVNMMVDLFDSSLLID